MADLAMPWYKAYPRDFFDATIGWSGGMKGSYRLLLDLIYMHDGRVPDDGAYLVSQLGLTSKRKWTVVKNYLLEQGKIELKNGYITNYRANIEILSAKERGKKRSDKNKKPNKNNGEFCPIDTDTEPPNPQGGDLPTALFFEFWEKYPIVNRGAERKALAKWQELSEDHCRQALARLSDFIQSTRSERMPTAATYLRDKRFESVVPLVEVPNSGTVERTVYDLIDDPQSWRNFFSTGVKFQGQELIVSTEGRKAKIDRFAGVLASEGFEVRAAL